MLPILVRGQGVPCGFHLTSSGDAVADGGFPDLGIIGSPLGPCLFAGSAKSACAEKSDRFVDSAGSLHHSVGRDVVIEEQATAEIEPFLHSSPSAAITGPRSHF